MTAIGATITTLTIENTATSAAGIAPATFGQVFAVGDLPASGAAVQLVGPTTLPAQMDVKATHADGSVRHAIISALVPSIAGSGSASYNIVRAVAAASSPAVPSDFSGLASVVSIVDAGVTYTASLATLLAGAYATWLAGDVVSEWLGKVPLVSSGAVTHPSITARFEVRAYKGQSKARIGVIIENSAVTANGAAAKHANYDITISVGGAQVYAKTGVNHLAFTRFRKSFWWGVAPTLHVRQNTAYLIASKAVPNYDPVLIGGIDQPTIASIKTALDGKKDVFQSGYNTAYMPTTGGRPEIGLITAVDAIYLLDMGAQAKDNAITQSELMGGWDAHRRDTATDRPINVGSYAANTPFSAQETYAVTGITAANPAVVTVASHRLKTGMLARIDSAGGMGINYNTYTVGAVTATTFALTGADTTGQTWTGGGIITPTNPNQIDTGHCPEVGFIPYLLTGDNFHLEELQFYSNFVMGDRFDTNQIRSQAWGIRAMAQALYITPDADPLKAMFLAKFNAVIADYDAKYTNNAAANKLGAIVNGSAWSDPDSTGNNTRTWQDDFFTQAVGHAVELGFTQAAGLFAYKAKYVVGRMNFCRMLSCPYSMKLRTAFGQPVFATLAEAYAATFPVDYPSTGNNILAQVHDSAAMAAQAGPTNFETIGANSIVGYPDSAIGFVANMQPALAYAVTLSYPGAAAAWTTYQGRTTKQNYSGLPEFAIVPRSVVAAAPSTPPPTGPTMTIKNRVKTTTTSTGTGALTTGAAAARCRALSIIPTGSSGVPLLIEDEAGTDWEFSYCTVTSANTFTRDTVIDGSAFPSKTNFGAGTKTVFCDVPAENFDLFLTPTSLAALGTTLETYLSANPGSTPGASDLFPVVEGAAMKGVSFSAIATAAQSAWPSAKVSTVIVATTTPFPLDFSTHNRRELWCTAAATINAPSSYASVGDDFSCDITNVSGGVVTLGTGIVGLPSGSTIPSGNSARIRAVAGTIYAKITSATAAPDNTVPTALSAAVANGGPTVVNISMSEAMSNTFVPAASAFTVSGHTVSSVAISGATISLTCSAAFVNGEAARTVAYTQPGTNNARDLAGNLLANFTALAITNNVAATGGGAAPFTIYGNSTTEGFEFMTALGTFNAQWFGEHITPDAGTTITSVSGSLCESNTVAPTSATTLSASVGSRGVWFPSITNYNNTGNWLINGSTVDVGISIPTPVNMYFWLFITDSTNKVWKFIYPAISVGDGVTSVKATAHITPTLVP